jgi:hypothetical protein
MSSTRKSPVRDNKAASCLFKMPFERLRNVSKISDSNEMLAVLDDVRTILSKEKAAQPMVG